MNEGLQPGVFSIDECQPPELKVSSKQVLREIRRGSAEFWKRRGQRAPDDLTPGELNECDRQEIAGMKRKRL